MTTNSTNEFVGVGANNDFYFQFVPSDTGIIVRSGAGDDWISASNASDYLIGGSGTDVLQGLGGNDVVYGETNGGIFLPGNYSDAILGGDGNDALFGVAGADYISGDAGFDLLNGGTGNDSLFGGTGADTLEGGSGDDIIYGGSPIAPSFAAFGTISVNTLITDDSAFGPSILASPNPEDASGDLSADSLSGGLGNDTLFGQGGADTLQGESGNDFLDGGTGADIMDGGVGDDSFLVDNAGDIVIDAVGGGSDVVTTSISYILGMAADIELLQTSNAAALDTINLTGSDTGNTIVGNAGTNTILGRGGNDVLDGRAGADIMDGGAGDDVYLVDNAFDAVSDASGFGFDRVETTVSYALGLSAEIETLAASQTVGAAALDLTGSNTNNTIVGTDGTNVLLGLGGKDNLIAGAGNDKLNGGLLSDALSGGAGKDTFVFNTKLDAKANLDKITDFIVKDDTIHLENGIMKKVGKAGKLAKDAFQIGSSAKDAEDRIIYNKEKGVLYYDADGIGAAKAVAFATISKNLKMTASDFFVI
ncbi:calcium-binding protein [Microvirga sp. BSC39]|uniref:calcium-binding protein n=1 Tax=Microvirga sp. BSC39 TaxID=1549810 RepID=UPI00068D2CD3|nr:calcium-binding protein [Microvirga sp. BSC39]